MNWMMNRQAVFLPRTNRGVLLGRDGCLRVYFWRQRETGKENLDACLFVYSFTSYALVCVGVCAHTFVCRRVLVSVCARTRTNRIFAQIRLAPLTGFGHEAWLPFCKHSQAKNDVFNLLICTNRQNPMLRRTMLLWPLPAVSPWNTIYTHGHFFWLP